MAFQQHRFRFQLGQASEIFSYLSSENIFGYVEWHCIGPNMENAGVCAFSSILLKNHMILKSKVNSILTMQYQKINSGVWQLVSLDIFSDFFVVGWATETQDPETHTSLASLSDSKTNTGMGKIEAISQY